MNAPFSTPDFRSASADLAALLALLVDPAATSARLSELVAQEKATQERIDALNAMPADTERLHNTAIATNIVADNRKTALDVRETELDKRQTAIESSEAARSDAALRRREIAVESREESNRREADRLSVMRADLEGRLAKLKALSADLGK